MMYGFRDEFLYFQCGKCDCLQIGEYPSDINKYYPENYYSFGKYDGGKFSGAFWGIQKRKYSFLIFGGNFIQKLMGLFSGFNNYLIFQGLNVDMDTRILDVGCGNGKSFLYPLAEVGFRNLLGCDPFLKNPFRYDNGLQIRNSNIFEIDGIWDIITYHHSFEHIPDPLAHLEKVSSMLGSNGVCIVRIPTVSSFAWEHYRTSWVQLDAPRHFFLHSKRSMQLLGEKSGLELYKIVYDSTHFQFSGSEKYLNGTPLSVARPKGLLSLLRRKFRKWQYQTKAKQLNTEGNGDQAAFFFRRRSAGFS